VQKDLWREREMKQKKILAIGSLELANFLLDFLLLLL
jgi:hypothetical protein